MRADAVSIGAEVRALRKDVDVRSLLEGDGIASLNASADHLDGLVGRLESPLLAPLRFAPVVGRQLSAASHQADASATGLRAAASVSEQLNGLVDDAVRSGPARVRALREVASVMKANRSAFDELDLGPDEGLIGQLAEGRARLEAEREEALETLDRAVEISSGLATFFEGPSDYLVLAANNSQMQNGQGMFLSAGVLHVAEGRMDLDSMESTADTPPASPPVVLDPDLAARWGWLDPNGDFRHLGLSHRFPVTAKTAAELWVASGKPSVDGVLVVDPFLLQVMMKASGPIVADGREIAAKNVVGFALHGQYQGYLKKNGNDGSFTAARRDQIEDIAVAALDGVEGLTSVDPDFLRQLAEAAAGRHLLGWAADPIVQAGWKASGIDGQISPTSALLSIVNRSGNKLDWFMRTSAELQLEPGKDGFEAVVRIGVTNQAPSDGEPAYVVGPYPGSGLAEGEYLGLVTLNLPEGATQGSFDGVDELAVVGGDGSNRTIAAWVRVPRGASTEMVARFRLPESMTSMTIEPSGRPWPTSWTMGTTRWADGKRHSVDLTAIR